MQLRLKFFSTIIIVFSLTACKAPKGGIFGSKKSAHEKYADGLTQAGLQQTIIGNAWLTAASNSLQNPQQVSIPYKEAGYFAAEKPSATAYIFSARRGEKILISITTMPASGFRFFAELWQPGDVQGKNNLLTAMDSLSSRMEYIVEKNGQYIIRVQPELLRSMEYTLTITAGASLAFPVQQSGKPKMISFWGVDRDGGARRHEGIDIAAAFRTPAVAAADGYVTRVNENKLGGKVIFMRPDNADYNLYYAHLDSQIAKEGQAVRTGDVIGLVGKTGNAQHTIPHLHFGIYANNGAIDPLAFIDNRTNEPKTITASTSELNKWMHLQNTINVSATPSSTNTNLFKANSGEAMLVTAATANLYKILLADGRTGFVNSNQLTAKRIRQDKLQAPARLLDEPNINAPAKTLLAKGDVIDVIGSHANFDLIMINNVQGWIAK